MKLVPEDTPLELTVNQGHPSRREALRNLRDRAEVMRPHVGAVDTGIRTPEEATGKPVLASPRLEPWVHDLCELLFHGSFIDSIARNRLPSVGGAGGGWRLFQQE